MGETEKFCNCILIIYLFNFIRCSRGCRNTKTPSYQEIKKVRITTQNTQLVSEDMQVWLEKRKKDSLHVGLCVF